MSFSRLDPNFDYDAFTQKALEQNISEADIERYLVEKGKAKLNRGYTAFPEADYELDSGFNYDAFMYQAKDKGISDGNIRQYLLDKGKIKPREKTGHIPAKTDFRYDVFRDNLLEKGYDIADIENYAVDRGYIPKHTYPSVTNHDETPQSNDSRVDHASELASAYNNMHNRYYKYLGTAYGAAMDSEVYQQMQRDNHELMRDIARVVYDKTGIKTVYDPYDGKIYTYNENNKPEEVDIDKLSSMKFELGGGIIGAMTVGHKMGSAVAGAIPHPKLKSVGYIGGLAAGTGLGAATGSAADFIINSYKLGEEVDERLLFGKMVDAGVASALGEIMFAGAWKGTKAITAPVAKKLTHYVKTIIHKGKPKAVAQLLKDFDLTEEQADELVNKVFNSLGSPNSQTGKDFAGRVRELDRLEKRVVAVMLTQPGAEQVIKANPELTATTVKSVSKRSAQINEAAERLAGGNDTGEQVQRTLKEYDTMVGETYEEVKQRAINLVDGGVFKFDIDKIMTIGTKDNKRFVNWTKLRESPDWSETNQINTIAAEPTMARLFELRELVNRYKNKAKVTAISDDYKKVIANIDKTIYRELRENDNVSPSQHKEWLYQYRKARKVYRESKKFFNRELVKKIMKGDKTEEYIVKQLKDFGPVIEDGFADLVTKLPKHLQNRVEGSILNFLTKRYTLGSDRLQAVDLVKLDEAIDKLNLKSLPALDFAKGIKELSQTFKNDTRLGANVMGIRKESFQSYLTTDPIERAKYAFASHIFNYMRTLPDTENAARQNLLRMLPRILENPVYSKDVNKLIRFIPKDKQYETKVLYDEFAKRWIAKTAQGNPKEYMEVYQASSGNTIKRSNGTLGEGYYYKTRLTNKLENRQPRKIERIKIADLETIRKIFNNEELTEENLKELPMLVGKLQEQGYRGIQFLDNVMLFDMGLRKDLGPLGLGYYSDYVPPKYRKLMAKAKNIKEVFGEKVTIDQIKQNPEIADRLQELGWLGISINKINMFFKSE